MIDHTSFSVSDYQKSKEFYTQTLAELGYSMVMEIDLEHVLTSGYGKDGKPAFWIDDAMRNKGNDDVVGKSRGHHVAFRAPSVEAVNRWYEKCIEFGGTDNGKPGPRPHYHSGYYGAFIIDPDGWRIETCFHGYKP